MRQASGYASGGVRATLRLEGAAVLLASILAYHWMHGRWFVLLALFLAPDLSFLGFAISQRWGTVSYNLVHSYVLPVILLSIGEWHPAAVSYALIWLAHIGFDRALGYGLKYRTGFGHTHLGSMGNA
jgi:hypothetical protein